MIKKVRIRNIEIYVFPNRQVFLDYVEDKKKILIAINAEKILHEDQKLHKIINENIGYTDGIGSLMAVKIKGLDAVKIPGAEFWLDIVGEFYKNKSFYLIGSSQDVIERTVDKLIRNYQNLNIVGFRSGFFNKNDKGKLINELRHKKPDVVFVAQGSPKQEFLMNELMKLYPALYMGLGGSFDIYCGLKQRAPKLFIKHNMEWIYRLLKEPTRLKRQLALIKFFILVKTRKL